VIVKFAPVSLGAKGSVMIINYKITNTSYSIVRSVSGTGVSPAFLAISPASFQFWSCHFGATASQSFIVSNSGQVAASGMSAAISGGFAFLGGSYPGPEEVCGSSLSAGASCSVLVSFSPASAVSFNGQANVSYNNGVSSQLAVSALSGAEFLLLVR